MPFSLVPPRAECAEWIDSLEPSSADFAASFEDVARVNRFLGGTRAVRTSLPALLRDVPVDRPVRILDIATGSADIPRALVHAARAGRFGGGRHLSITAVDNHPKVLALARERTPPDLYPEIRVERADAFALPYPDGTFDLALCSLAFHHFGYDRCVFLLKEMERLTTRGFLVNDLLRDWVACGLIWGLTRLVGANRLTQHDGPLSVRRAYTRAEYEQMLRDAGIPDAECSVRLAPMYRAVALRIKPG
jgi:ubiquinone/menaquinone biosynthesis C-methylase UbiE